MNAQRDTGREREGRREKDVGLLPLHTFSAMHLEHIVSHPPDDVLFPFLHGLEGDNAAQNAFFAGAGVRVPKHRGLVWVVCEEDLKREPARFGRSLSVLCRRGGVDNSGGDGGGGVRGGEKGESPSESEDTSESTSSDCFDDDDDDDEEDDDDQEDEPMHVYPEPRVIPMDIDINVEVDVDVVLDADDDSKLVKDPHHAQQQQHMHPVIQRPPPILTSNLDTYVLSICCVE